MSDTVTPDKQEIVRELYSRRSSLDPQKRAVVEELASRMGLSQTQPLPGTLAQRQQASKEQFDKNVPTTAQSLGINSNLPGEVLQHSKWLGSTLLNTEPEANDPTFKNPASAFVGAGAPGAGNYAGFAAGVRTAPIVEATRNFLNRNSVGLLKRLLPNVELEHLTRAGSDLKAAEAVTGSIKDVPSALAAEEHAATTLNDKVGNLLGPQKDVVVPGSKDTFIKAQIDHIPTTIKLHDQPKYEKLVQDIQARYANRGDFTLGELNDSRVSANAQLRNYYSKGTGAQLTADEQLNSAMLQANSEASRAAFEQGIDTVGLGGGREIKSLSQRIGSLLKTKDGLQKLSNPAEVQATAPPITRFGQKLSSVSEKLRGHTDAFDKSLSINNDITNTFKNWKGTPAEFSQTGSGAVPGKAPNGGSPAFVRPTNTPAMTPPVPRDDLGLVAKGKPPTLAGAQTEMVPAHGPGMLAGPETSPVTYKPNDQPPVTVPESPSKPYQPGMAPMDAVPGQQAWSNATAASPKITPNAPVAMDVPVDPNAPKPRFGQPTPYAPTQAVPDTVDGSTPGTFAQPPGQTDLQKGIPPALFGIDVPGQAVPAQRSLGFGFNGVDQTLPPLPPPIDPVRRFAPPLPGPVDPSGLPVTGSQGVLAAPKTETELFLERMANEGRNTPRLTNVKTPRRF